MKPIDQITQDVIGIAMRIHRELGPGLFENVYETVLAGKLVEMGYKVDRQMPVDIHFEGSAYPKQVLTYLRLMKLPVGLVINFNGATLKEGIRRVVNDHDDSASSAPLR